MCENTLGLCVIQNWECSVPEFETRKPFVDTTSLELFGNFFYFISLLTFDNDTLKSERNTDAMGVSLKLSFILNRRYNTLALA